MKNTLKLCVGVGAHAPKGRAHECTYESKMPPKEIEGFVIGGEYWDAISWVTGAWAYYTYTGNKEFLKYAYKVTKTSLGWFESEEFDTKYKLFMGPASYADGVASYPKKYMVGAKGSSFILDNVKKPDGTYDKFKMKALSTNCLYYNAYRIAAQMGKILGDSPEQIKSFERNAKVLKKAINKYFWSSKKGRYAYFIDENGTIDTSMEGLGEPLAILTEVAGKNRAEQIYKNQYIANYGIPCLWPVYPRFKPEYGRHCGTIWPFIQGFWAWAAYKYKNMSLFASEFENLAKLATQENEFREIYHPVTGKPYGGIQCGKLWHSTHNQTWSATAYLSMVYHNLFGMNFQPDKIEFNPLVPSEFSEQPIRLLDMKYRNATLDISIYNWGDKVDKFILDGKIQPLAVFPASLSGRHKIDIYMVKVNSLIK
jgi:glycogen debranching enzyme